MEKRTYYCGELRSGHSGLEVVLAGWVQRVRDIGQLVFLELRDREGSVQVVFTADLPALLEEAKKLRPEYVVTVKGYVQKRSPELINPQMPSGEIEVVAREIEILAQSKVPPFQVVDPVQATEELRFKYRYIDLRRPSMQSNIRLRHQAALTVRNYLSNRGFIEVETPFLTSSTPEGARDYLVPSRIHKGRFYALPQSPQLFKQLLMVAGFDRYFQIVRCFRDEDLRADRQPEFTQIDIEMSFCEREDIYEMVEGLMAAVFDLIGEKVTIPIRRLTHAESMNKFGTDKPDLRLGMEIIDLTADAPAFASENFWQIISQEGVIKALSIREGAKLSRSQIDKITDRVKNSGAKAIAWVRKLGGWKSSLKVPEKTLEFIWNKCSAGDNDIVFLAAGERQPILQIFGEVRREFVLTQAKDQKLYEFAWITDFPLFEWSEEEKRLVSVHHPFTAPHPQDLPKLKSEPASVRSLAYDIVLNGYEIGGGSIRIHDREVQNMVFQALGLSAEEAEKKFGFLLGALSYGAPPHGGIALGFDRIVMLLAGEESLREVIPFPKTTNALCLLTNSPSEVSPRQLEELGIKINK